MKKHRPEGNLIGILYSHHDHAGYPEEQDVVATFQNAGGIESLQVFRVFRPDQSGMGPQAGTEPGIQYVRVLTQITGATTGTAG